MQHFGELRWAQKRLQQEKSFQENNNALELITVIDTKSGIRPTPY